MPYIGKSTDGMGVRSRFLFLADASDTSVSGADASGATLSFSDGAYVDVYLNGVLLKAGTDYNTSTANTVAGLSALAANDEVTVIVYDIFTVGDMVSASDGGTFVGNVAMSGTLDVTGATTTAAITASGLVTANAKIDLNGTELILDGDADTSITADTDDQIDIRIAGADDFQFTANTFTAQSGSTIAAQALTATTGTFSGILKTDDTTDATSTTDGSLQTDGGLSVAKDAVIGDDLLMLSDSAAIKFGADSDIELRHVADQGLTLKLPSTSGNSGAGPILNISTGDTDIAAGNQLGTINFQAPDEGTGTDAVLVGASITAIAQADFSSSVNSTSLVLRSSNSGTNDGGYLEVTNAGPVRMTKQPVFICKYNAFSSGTTSTNPASNYQTPAINIGSHFNASNGVFTAPVDGAYVFFGSILSTNNNVVSRIYFEKNGSVNMGFQHEARTTEGHSSYDKQFCHAIITLAANDTVELVIYQDSTNTFYSSSDHGYNSFSGYLIG